MRISDWSSDVCSSDLSVCYLNGGLFMEAARPRLIQRLLLGPLGSWLSRRLSYPRFARSFAAIFGAHTQPSASELAQFWHLIAHDEMRSEAHTSELQSLMRISYAVFCLKKKTDEINSIHV